MLKRQYIKTDYHF